MGADLFEGLPGQFLLRSGGGRAAFDGPAAPALVDLRVSGARSGGGGAGLPWEDLAVPWTARVENFDDPYVSKVKENLTSVRGLGWRGWVASSAIALEKIGSKEKAAKTMQAAVHAGPARGYADTGEWKQALEHARKPLAQAPDALKRKKPDAMVAALEAGRATAQERA